MRKLLIQRKNLLVILCVILVLTPMSSGDQNSHICEYAIAQCFGEASLWDWVSQAVLGHILYCLNGYGFCKEFVEAFI